MKGFEFKYMDLRTNEVYDKVIIANSLAEAQVEFTKFINILRSWKQNVIAV